MMNEREWWERSEELAILARLKKFRSLLQDAIAEDLDSVLKVIVTESSEEVMEDSTPERDNLIHSISQARYLLTNRDIADKEIAIEFSKMVDSLLTILRAERLPHEPSLSRAFRWVVANIMRRDILDTNPELLLLGRQIQLYEDVAARLAEVIAAFKVTSVDCAPLTDPPGVLRSGSEYSLGGKEQ